MHSVFLFHAIEAGMDMGIVNAGQLVVYEDIPEDLLKHVNDVLFDARLHVYSRPVQLRVPVTGSTIQVTCAFLRSLALSGRIVFDRSDRVRSSRIP